MSRLVNNMESRLRNVVHELEQQINHLNHQRKPKAKTKAKAKSHTGNSECYRTLDNVASSIDKQLGHCIFNANSRKEYLKCLRAAHSRVGKLDDTIPKLCDDKLNKYRAKIYLGGTWDIQSTIDCLSQGSKDKQAVIDCINDNKPLT